MHSYCLVNGSVMFRNNIFLYWHISTSAQMALISHLWAQTCTDRHYSLSSHVTKLSLKEKKKKKTSIFHCFQQSISLFIHINAVCTLLEISLWNNIPLISLSLCIPWWTALNYANNLLQKSAENYDAIPFVSTPNTA